MVFFKVLAGDRGIVYTYLHLAFVVIFRLAFKLKSCLVTGGIAVKYPEGDELAWDNREMHLNSMMAEKDY